MEMGYKYFSLLFNYIRSPFWHNLAHALLQDRVRSIWGFCSRPSHSHGHVPRETGRDLPRLVFMERLIPGELEQGLLSKKEPYQGRSDTSCPRPPRWQHTIINACMIDVYDCWSWYFYHDHVLKSLPNFLVPYTEQFVHQVISGFANCYIYMSHRTWFCELLNFHCNKYFI